MGSVAVAVTRMGMSWIVLKGAYAQGTVTCNTGQYAPAPFNDATELVQRYRVAPESSNFFNYAPCVLYWFHGEKFNAAAIICAPFVQNTPYYIAVDVFASYLNEILAQCNDLKNEMQGVYKLSPEITFALNSRTSVSGNC